MSTIERRCGNCEYEGENPFKSEACMSCIKQLNIKPGFKLKGELKEMNGATTNVTNNHEREMKNYIPLEVGASPMSEIAKREFITRMKALSAEEMQILSEIIPLELCYERINKELIKAEKLRADIKELAGKIG